MTQPHSNSISDYQPKWTGTPNLKLHGNLKRNLSGRNFHLSLFDPIGAKGGTEQFSASEIQKFFTSIGIILIKKLILYFSIPKKYLATGIFKLHSVCL